jgi:hypothetical protein
MYYQSFDNITLHQKDALSSYTPLPKPNTHCQ